VPNISLADLQYEEKRRQWELVEAFFAAFRNPDGSIRGGFNLASREQRGENLR
jgi:hypothetical protein